MDGTLLRGTDTAHRLCDSAFQFLTMDPNGVPLRLGHEQRFANRAQRRASRARDGNCCIFPGCDRTTTQMHHVRHYNPDSPDGPEGPTDLENMGNLCPIHHWLTHQPGWHMYATDDQWFWWQTPNNHTFWSQRHGKPREGIPPPQPVTT